MRLTNGEAPGNLLHGLNNAAEVADRLERDFMEMRRALTTINLFPPDGENNGRVDSVKASTATEAAINVRMAQIESFITLELVKKVETLFQRVSYCYCSVSMSGPETDSMITIGFEHPVYRRS